jgi:hypothetical protein
MENTIPLDNSGPSSASIVLEARAKVIEQSIFGVRLSNAEQEVSIPEVVEPGKSGNNNSPSNAIKINAQKVEPVPKVTTEPIKEVGIHF